MSEHIASVNGLSAPLVSDLVKNSASLRVGIERLENGCTVIDAGIKHPGGLEAGRRIAEICLGGLGRVSYVTQGALADWPLTIHVHTTNPVLACLGSQYAGWSLSHGEGKSAFHALGSGPGRALAVKEKPLYEELKYRDSAEVACLVLEVDKIPPLPLVDKIARDCGVAPDALTLILTPTRSLAGTAQVIARVVEVAMHKAHSLHFPLEDIVDASGSAPMAPPAKDFVQAMGRTNDAILFAGQVQLYVRGTDEAAQNLAQNLPSSASRDYGRPFAEIFKACNYDFFKIDPMLFSPASVLVSNLDTGNTFRGGRLDPTLLNVSFGNKP
jgi:methenyltetrahydromethanopterin cyclohydrolase